MHRPAPPATARRFDRLEAAPECEPCCRTSANEARPSHPHAPASPAPEAMPPAEGFQACRAEHSFAAPRGAGGGVFQHYPFGLELVPNSIGGREIAVLLRLGALDNARVDPLRTM